ncbi:MAG: hypothetical protein LQ351_001682 [Letrouitia transgressa]|nr:MAG: hypothetical protein LQ351_001682 [Letrouitia transgressa]
MSKLDRRNQAKQIRQIKHQENSKSTSIFSGQQGAPRIVAVVPMWEECDVDAIIRKLSDGKDLDARTVAGGPTMVKVDRFKQTVLYVPATPGLFTALDICRVADFVILVLSAEQGTNDDREQLLRAIESQGVSNVITVVQDLDKIQPSKKQPQFLSSLKSYINHFFPQEKLYSLDSDRDCANVIRSLCSTVPKGVKWREDRSWMLVEDVRWPEPSIDSGSRGEVIVSGVVRGKGLKANRLVQIGNWGHFQIEKITDATLPIPAKNGANAMVIEPSTTNNAVLEVPDADQDDLAELAPFDENMADSDNTPVSEAPTTKRGVLLDEHRYFSDDESHLPPPPKRLPKGTSPYQAAWFLGDMSDFSDEDEDEDELDEDGDLAMDGAPQPENGMEGLDNATQREPTDAVTLDYPPSEMFLDPSPDEEMEQLAEYRARRKDEALEDREFPDEIELHPNVLARERLARYRGLKNLRTSRWETHEDKGHEPEDWERLLPISDYKHALRQVTNEALVGGVPPGKRVSVHLRNVPLSLRATYNSTEPLVAISLLRHEQKRAVVNFTITLSSEASRPLKSKEDLVLQCGPRRFHINPLFSQTGNTPNNVHKFLRYLHPGQTAMATFVAPLTWGSVPAIFFKLSTAERAKDFTDSLCSESLVATGTSQPPSSGRVIAKRVILTGHPYKIHKKLVTVRYMFFNKEDVEWFKALQLWTKRGRSGFFKESLGTHGYFKATFDGRVNPQDAIGISLYKRMFPRHAHAWAPEGEIS